MFGQFASSQGSLMNRFLSSEDMHSQESNKSDFLVSHSNMIPEFDSSANPNSNHPVPSSKIYRLDFSNLMQSPQASRGGNSTSNTIITEIKKPSKEVAAPSETKNE